MFEAAESLANYWEQRAARYARERDGLAAVCSFGMPQFYNRAIDTCQRRALKPWLEQLADADVLEVGAGVGRWTERLAAQGNRVMSIDLSPTMATEARRRLERCGLEADIRVADVTEFDTSRRFDAILSVTVLQHVTDEAQFDEVFARLAGLLRPGGRMLLLEVAPTGDTARCDSPIFRARPLARYRAALERAGCRVETVGGVDPMPFKTWVLPWLRRVPRPLAVSLAAIATAASLPLDLLLADRLVARSWHKVIVARRPESACAAI